MTRRRWLCVAAALAGCGTRNTGPVLPETVAGSWRRTSLREIPAGSAPDPLPRGGVHRAETASYEGPGSLEATVYELTSSAAGLDAVQRWPPAPDTVFFYAERYFVVIRWKNADRTALRAFVREMEQRLGKK